MFKHFVKSEKIIVIEEGFSNYTEKHELYHQYGIGSLKFLIYRLILLQGNLLNYLPYGYDQKVKEIWLSGIRNIPSELKNKVRLFDLKSLWETANRDVINRIFSFNINLYRGKSVLLTQPLSEDGICRQDLKIEIYRNIISSLNTPVILKKHPRDTTKYDFNFENIYFDNDLYPFELLILNQVDIKCVITITSTVAFQCIGICDVKIIGTENYPELQGKMGIHPYQYFPK